MHGCAAAEVTWFLKMYSFIKKVKRVRKYKNIQTNKQKIMHKNPKYKNEKFNTANTKIHT
jgi:hypothetical protein